jgi:hypothetical protein
VITRRRERGRCDHLLPPFFPHLFPASFVSLSLDPPEEKERLRERGRRKERKKGRGQRGRGEEENNDR